MGNGIVSRGAAPSLTKAQKTELDRRLADHLANSNDVDSWGEVKSAAENSIFRVNKENLEKLYEI